MLVKRRQICGNVAAVREVQCQAEFVKNFGDARTRSVAGLDVTGFDCSDDHIKILECIVI